MFRIEKNTKKIYLTRGDIASIRVSAKKDDGENYVFQIGDVVRFKVFKKRGCNCVVLQKDTTVTEETEEVVIELFSKDTKIGDIINRDTDYWYEIELNPDTNPQTIVGYDVDEYGRPIEKIFKLLPEGDDVK